MPKFVFSRASIVEELFTVDAEDLETAQQMVYDGAPEVKIQQGEWIDWYHDEYTLESGEDDGQPDEAQEWADFGEVYNDEHDGVY